MRFELNPSPMNAGTLVERLRAIGRIDRPNPEFGIKTLAGGEVRTNLFRCLSYPWGCGGEPGRRVAVVRAVSGELHEVGEEGRGQVLAAFQGVVLGLQERCREVLNPDFSELADDRNLQDTVLKNSRSLQGILLFDLPSAVVALQKGLASEPVTTPYNTFDWALSRFEGYTARMIGDQMGGEATPVRVLDHGIEICAELSIATDRTVEGVAWREIGVDGFYIGAIKVKEKA